MFGDKLRFAKTVKKKAHPKIQNIYACVYGVIRESNSTSTMKERRWVLGHLDFLIRRICMFLDSERKKETPWHQETCKHNKNTVKLIAMNQWATIQHCTICAWPPSTVTILTTTLLTFFVSVFMFKSFTQIHLKKDSARIVDCFTQ